MTSDGQPIADWVNFPENISTLSLWTTLHDGSLLPIESDPLARTVTLRFEVEYVRSHHQLPEGTQFVIAISGVQSVRSLHSISWPGDRNWREESQSWTDFERSTNNDLEVSTVILGLGSDVVALKLGLLAESGSYEEAYIRGEGATFSIGKRQVTPEEFAAFGEAYWEAFAAKRRNAPASAR